MDDSDFSSAASASSSAASSGASSAVFSGADRELLARLVGVFRRVDPVPEAVIGAAEVAPFRVRPARRRLALLRTGAAGLAVRGGAELTFAAADLLVTVEVSNDHSGLVGVGGLVTPVGSVTSVTVCSLGGERVVEVDGFGHFGLSGLPRGPLSLVVGDAQTPWFLP